MRSASAGSSRASVASLLEGLRAPLHPAFAPSPPVAPVGTSRICPSPPRCSCISLSAFQKGILIPPGML
eukprot:5422388-Pleurochrysis_carterae.AAC.1